VVGKHAPDRAMTFGTSPLGTNHNHTSRTCPFEYYSPLATVAQAQKQRYHGAILAFGACEYVIVIQPREKIRRCRETRRSLESNTSLHMRSSCIQRRRYEGGNVGYAKLHDELHLKKVGNEAADA